MAFVPAAPLLSTPRHSSVTRRRHFRAPLRTPVPALTPCAPRAQAPDLSRVPPSPAAAPIYGDEDDVCTFGAECQLSPDCVLESPALDLLAEKYVLPMRNDQTQVFFDNAAHPLHTLLIVFAHDRHGLVLDVVSVLKALGVRVHRTASSENDAVRMLVSRTEGELRSVKELGISLENCVAFWVTDEESGDKIFEDGDRLTQLTACLKIELDAPYPRPRPAFEDRWHRVSVQKNRADRYSVFSVQTPDRPRLLAEVSHAFDRVGLDIASASIETLAERVENTFFVTKRGFKEPLADEDIVMAVESVMRALLAAGDPGPHETLWYQTRDGSAVLVAEAIFVDEVNNSELACLKFSKFETPNFRGRLPEAPYRPILLE